MANETPAQTLDETLNKTELGHVINENKNLILICAAVVTALVVGYSVMRHQGQKAENESLDAAYSFQSSVIEPFMDGKIDGEQAVKKIQNMDSSLTGSPNLAPSIFEAVGKLVKENKMEEAVGILETWHKSFPEGSHLRFMAGLRLAPILEDSGKQDEAIAVYEGLIKGSHDVLESRVYLELGRLYLEKGDQAKAKSFFEHVVKYHEGSEEAKFARLYLQKL